MISRRAYEWLRDSVCGNVYGDLRARFSRAYGIMKNGRKPGLVEEVHNGSQSRYLFEIDSNGGALGRYDVYLEFEDGKFITGSCTCPDNQKNWFGAFLSSTESASELRVPQIPPEFNGEYVPLWKLEHQGVQVIPGDTFVGGDLFTPIFRKGVVCKHILAALMTLYEEQLNKKVG